MWAVIACDVAVGHLSLKNKSFTKIDILRTFACLIDVTYFSDENTTVNGTVHILDMDKFGLMHQSFMSMEERRDFVQTWQVRECFFKAFVGRGWSLMISLIVWHLSNSERILHRSKCKTNRRSTVR
jgi:hypothetical protein